MAPFRSAVSRILSVIRQVSTFKDAEIFRSYSEVGSYDLLGHFIQYHRPVFHHGFESFLCSAVVDRAFLEFMTVELSVSVMEHEYGEAMVILHSFPEFAFWNT